MCALTYIRYKPTESSICMALSVLRVELYGSQMENTPLLFLQQMCGVVIGSPRSVAPKNLLLFGNPDLTPCTAPSRAPVAGFS